MDIMVDTHTHTILSDGALLPAELIRRAEVHGYRVLALTDHVDCATVETVVPRLVEAAAWENRSGKVLVVPGVEITHVRPEQIAECARRARALGALLVLCHGETLAEPVAPGTNRAAIEAGVDILAHPGLIVEEDVRRAAAQRVALEITAKAGHSLANGHVAALALRHGAALTFGTDAHEPEHLRTREQALAILRGAALSAEAAKGVLESSERILRARDAAHDARGEPV